jgi:hypothetical protein
VKAKQLNARPKFIHSFRLYTINSKGVHRTFEVHGMGDLFEAHRAFVAHPNVPDGVEYLHWEISHIGGDIDEDMEE